MTFETKDTGVREEQGTGAVRDSRTGKGRYDLLPPHAIRRLAQVYERGAAKYADRNWEKGMAFSRYIDSALRHINQHLEGRRDEDHIGHAVFNLMAILEHQERISLNTLDPKLDDLPVHPELTRSQEYNCPPAHELAAKLRKRHDDNIASHLVLREQMTACTCRSTGVPTEQPRLPEDNA